MGRPSRSGQTTPSVFEHGLDLLARHAGKPREKIIHASAIFEVFEQCFHGNARALEHPDAADFSGHPFDRWTLAPIKHDPSIRPVTSNGKPYVIGTGRNEDIQLCRIRGCWAHETDPGATAAREVDGDAGRGGPPRSPRPRPGPPSRA